MSIFSSLAQQIETGWSGFLTKRLPLHTLDIEGQRHAKLVPAFAAIGGVFSLLYAAFYLLIGHPYGAVSILAGSILFCVLPAFFLKKGDVDRAASFFIFILFLLFVILCAIEGGVRGHAVAWLASIPILAQLMMPGRRQAVLWSCAVIAMVFFFAGSDLAGFHFPMLYPEPAHGLVTFAGYGGLGLFLLILGVLSEQTRRKVAEDRDRAQAQLTEAVEDLTRLNKEKNEFLGIAAHDLNNPLTVVGGYAEMLVMQEEDNPETKEFAQEIANSTHRMKKIIQDVLDVNRIESGEYPLSPEPVELPLFMETCVSPYQIPISKKDLNLKIDVADVNVNVDTGALNQVMENLISNAVKYSDTGGEIRLDAEVTSSQVVLRVYNEGKGFTEEDLEKVFQRFAKLSTRPTGGEGSVGLGLSITRKIVEAMGGEIRCESEWGSWARFEVTLPKVEPEGT